MSLQWMPKGQRPTEPGWYWIEGGSWSLHIGEYEGGTLVDLSGRRERIAGVDWEGARFAGPLVPPTEATQ